MCTHLMTRAATRSAGALAASELNDPYFLNSPDGHGNVSSCAFAAIAVIF